MPPRFPTSPASVAVSAPGGSYVEGRAVGPPASATGVKDGSVWLSVAIEDPSSDSQSREELDRLRAVPVPGGAEALFTGAQPAQPGLGGRNRPPLAVVLTARRDDHVPADLPAHRQPPASGEGAGPQHVVAVGHARCAGVGISGRAPWADSAPRRPAPWSPTCWCSCSRPRSACPWTTRCSCCPGSGNTGSRHPSAARTTPRRWRSASPAPGGSSLRPRC